MSPEQAKIVLLEDVLIQSYHTISFMHNCLTDFETIPCLNSASGITPDSTANGAYVYTYPEQTIEQLTKIKNLVKIPEGCLHSRRKADCPSCVDADRQAALLYEAKTLLANEPN